jgi:hypothetical protein
MFSTSGNPRTTMFGGKKAIYGWTLIKIRIKWAGSTPLECQTLWYPRRNTIQRVRLYIVGEQTFVGMKRRSRHRGTFDSLNPLLHLNRRRTYFFNLGFAPKTYRMLEVKQTPISANIISLMPTMNVKISQYGL